jgi:hypothetical protein
MKTLVESVYKCMVKLQFKESEACTSEKREKK